MLSKLRRSSSDNDLIPRTLREMSKQYSRLELITVNLLKRDKALFEVCKSSLEKGQRERAVIYANEIAEIRKTISVINSTKLLLERTITRLETIKTISPFMKEVRGLFNDVQNMLKLLTDVMPAITPEMDALNNVVTEILTMTQAGPVSPIEPLVIKDASTEAILREAAGVVEEELMRKMPEPPMTTASSSPDKIAKPMIALTTGGTEIYESTAEDPSLVNSQPSQPSLKNLNSLSEELVLDYIYRNNGDIDIAQCAEELNMSQNEVLNILDLLNTRGKIRIEQ